MHFPTFTTLTAVVLSLAVGTSQAAIGGNAHANARPRRAQHFGRQQTAEQLLQPPPGAKVYTTHIAKPEGYNATHVAGADGEMIRRGEGVVDLEARGGPVGKRAFSGMRATYYAIGLGACGQYDSEPAYIVALNSAQYGGGYPGPQCFKSITITGGSRNGHAVATIKDECPTCPYGGLDMSEALFSNFASADEGVATITWWFNDEAPPPPPPAPTTSSTPAWTPAPEPTTSSTPVYVPPPSTSTTPAYTPPTTTWTPPTTSSVWTPPAETSTSSSYVAPPPSSSSSSYTPSSSSSASSSSASSATPSSSVASSSAASASSLALNSLALGKSASVTATGSRTASATGSASTGTDGNGNNAVSGDSDYYNGAQGNLEMMSDVTLQLGNMIVMSAQKAR